MRSVCPARTLVDMSGIWQGGWLIPLFGSTAPKADVTPTTLYVPGGSRALNFPDAPTVTSTVWPLASVNLTTPDSGHGPTAACPDGEIGPASPWNVPATVPELPLAHPATSNGKIPNPVTSHLIGALLSITPLTH